MYWDKKKGEKFGVSYPLSGTVACKGLHAELMNFKILCTDQCQYLNNCAPIPPLT